MPKFKKKIYDFMTIISDDSAGEIWIHGDITDDAWYDTDVTPKRIRDTLNEMGPVGTLNIRVNSYGGSVVAGNAIINILDSYKRKNGTKIHAYIEGIAASMGSGIPMVADYIYMAENAMFMIHKPYSLAIGNADDFEHEKEVLEKVEDTLIVNYMRHFNGSEEELRQMMADETWLTADEAITYGFCDEIIPAVAVAASAKGININGIEFKDTADLMKDKFKEYQKEGKEMFDYDETLASYGISEEKFSALNISADAVLDLAKGIWTYHDDVNPPVEPFMTTEQVLDALGEEMDANAVLDLAKAGKSIDLEMNKKAESYDNLVKEAINKSIASGIKAKGDDFNETKWRKILSSLDYEEILDQMHEWDAEAKIAVKAGKRVSEPWDNKFSKNTSANIDEYKF